LQKPWQREFWYILWLVNGKLSIQVNLKAILWTFRLLMENNLISWKAIQFEKVSYNNNSQKMIWQIPSKPWMTFEDDECFLMIEKKSIVRLTRGNMAWNSPCVNPRINVESKVMRHWRIMKTRDKKKCFICVSFGYIIFTNLILILFIFC
jgi:hypothetical protein